MLFKHLLSTTLVIAIALSSAPSKAQNQNIIQDQETTTQDSLANNKASILSNKTFEIAICENGAQFNATAQNIDDMILLTKYKYKRNLISGVTNFTIACALGYFGHNVAPLFYIPAFFWALEIPYNFLNAAESYSLYDLLVEKKSLMKKQ